MGQTREFQCVFILSYRKLPSIDSFRWLCTLTLSPAASVGIFCTWKKEKKRKIEMKPKPPAARGDELCEQTQQNIWNSSPMCEKTRFGPMYFPSDWAKGPFVSHLCCMMIMDPDFMLICVSRKAITRCVSLCEVTRLHKPHYFWKEVSFPKMHFLKKFITFRPQTGPGRLID